MLYTKGWVDIAKITTPNIVNYCRKHDYSWNIQCIGEPYDAFEKIRQIQGIFERNEADVVMSMDCDALITNYTIRIEDFIEGDERNFFFVCRDYNGINTGTFLITKYGGQTKFLNYLLSLKDKNIIMGGKSFICSCEQDALNIVMYMYNGLPYSKVKVLSHPSINSYMYELYPEIPPQTHEQGQWQEGDFILHLPGIGMGQRKQILSNTKVIYE